MKKRLRRKRCLGEFREYCFDLLIYLKETTNSDDFMDDLIVKVVSTGCLVGGTVSKGGKVSVIITGRNWKSPMVKNRVIISDWVFHLPGINGCYTERLVDANK